MGRKSVDLSGRKFNKITVIKRNNRHENKNGHIEITWLCKCDCGNVLIITTSNLKKIKSCGNCKNTYDLSGEYGVGYTSKGEEFYFDLEDYDKIKDYWWCKDYKGYIVSNNQKMHRIILNMKNSNKMIDHINGNKGDNRKSNLRKATNSQNQMNVGLRINNTSGITGVNWDKKHNKWRATICINKKRLYKYFYDFNEAVKQRLIWEEIYFKNFSYKNSRRKD